MQQLKLIKSIGFQPKENAVSIFIKTYADKYSIEINTDKNTIHFGGKIKVQGKDIQNITKPEDWVVVECINRLLEKGYAPENISLEKVYPSGHGTSGRLDICVTRKDKSEYLLIECKTYGKEFDKAFARLKKDGGQLFTYFKFSNKADLLMLYASELNGNQVISKSEIIKIEDEYRVGDVKDFYDKWNKLTKDNGVFDNWVNAYQFVSKALTPKLLKPIQQEDSGFIFNRFLEILRNNVVSDKGNAFNKIFTLFLCKVYDEKSTKENDELKFQWLEGKDDDISFQLRLTDLYKNGMLEFLEKQVTDFSEEAFENKFKHLKPEDKKDLLYEIHKLRLEKNNEFAIKEVFDNASFKENAKVVKQVVELLQGYRIRYNKRQQYLSDFFELLLTTGLKQEAGQFFTPVPIAQFIIKSMPIDKLVNEKLEKGETSNLLPFIIDYAAGSGHFLTESMHEIQRHLDNKNPKDYIKATANKIDNWQNDHFDWATQYVYGIEKDYRLVKVGKVGCYLHGDGLANVILSDGLASFKHSKEYKGLLKKTDADFPKENKQFDVLLSNPPYSVPAFKQTAREFYTDNDFEIYNTLTDQSSQIEALFVERAKQLLKDGGMAGIILPSSILSNEGIYTKCREIILQYFDILAITELGSNTFMATGTNTVVLFLRRRNNYVSINLKKSLEGFLTTLKDVTLNGIEKPVGKYVSHSWQTISFTDYITLLQKKPNKAIEEHELYKEYKKKIKAKNEEQFWQNLINTEIEKLYYFILACPQKIVLVKSGEKDAEKRFLGYEFSNRRGSEGIHPMQRGRHIEECTQLFDPNTFDNPQKASTYIYKAFNGDFDFEIDPLMQKHIDRMELIDLLSFDRTSFEKGINLNAKKKLKTQSKFETSSLENLVTIQSGLWIGKNKPLKKINVLRNTNFKNNNGKLNFEDVAEIEVEEKQLLGRALEYSDIIIEKSGGSDTQAIGRVALFEEKSKNIYSYSNFCSRIRVNNKAELNPIFLWIFLNDFYNKGGTIPLQNGVRLLNIDLEEYKKIKIPLPPKNIQQKIVDEIEKLEEKEKKAIAEIEVLQTSASLLVATKTTNSVKLQDITIKIGSGATPSGGESSYIEKGITLIRSQNVYDNEFYTKGLAFIDDEQAKKLNNVTVEENDILFNITGASVCRCCIVDKSFLPARVNQHVSIIRVNEKALSKYVQLVLVSPEYKSKLLDIARGATSREAITKSQLEEFKIPLQSLPEQQKIVAQIQKIEKQIAALQKQIDTIPQQKETVLKKHL